MKQHTSGFKNNIKKIGKEIDSIITYGQTTLHDELYAVTPHYEASLLKSVMKQLDVESSVDIPLNTIINYQLGVKVGNSYEYLDYGNYVVFKSEKKEDTNTYLLTCYDKMLYAMKQNEDLGVTYPITIKNYLTAVVNKIGLQVATTNFYNQDLQIPIELYLGLQYTYRDILDEIAQATGSMILLNSNDQIELKYLNLIQDTIDKEFLKDINVKFGEKYGPINSVVLSRAGESDNVYLRNEQSVTENGLCEIKIKDNQIMNFNNRADFLPGILNAVNGIEYYLNDFTSTGILYLECGDYYNVEIDENTYKCLMLNDEIEITSGIQELVHTDRPEVSETDYSKADKTDMRINQTYIIVDKQNQTINSVVTNVTEQNNKISQITQTVNELNSKIQDVADITTFAETVNGTLNFTDINQSEPIEIKIYPTTKDIRYTYPMQAVVSQSMQIGVFPSNDTYMNNRVLRFTNTTTNEVFDYELPEDLLIVTSGIYAGTKDEFYLGYDQQICQVTKRCRISSFGRAEILQFGGEPYEEIHTYPFPSILLTDGDYTVELLSYDEAYMGIRLMSQNIYTSQFATKAELTSSITQTANEINLRVDEKLDEEDFTSANIILKINNDQSTAQINADKVSLNGKTIDLTSQEININSNNFSVDETGKVVAKDISIKGGDITLEASGVNAIRVFDANYNNNTAYMSYMSETSVGVNSGGNEAYLYAGNGSSSASANRGYFSEYVRSPEFINTSKESLKDDIKIFNSKALEIIKQGDIYSFYYKNDSTKYKRLGFIIGEKNNYNTPEIVIDYTKNGIDLYSMNSICWKAIQEQQEQIEQLQKEIKELKGEKHE